MNAPTKDVPRPAQLLGYAGLVPFLLGGALPWIRSEWSTVAVHYQLAYAAIILSFMGAVHWGLAMADGRDMARRMTVSVIPAIAGWLCFFVSIVYALPLLILLFTALLFYDLRAVRAGLAPAWYPSLRVPLTVVAALSLALAWLHQINLIG